MFTTLRTVQAVNAQLSVLWLLTRSTQKLQHSVVCVHSTVNPVYRVLLRLTLEPLLLRRGFAEVFYISGSLCIRICAMFPPAGRAGRARRGPAAAGAPPETNSGVPKKRLHACPMRVVSVSSRRTPLRVSGACGGASSSWGTEGFRNRLTKRNLR